MRGNSPIVLIENWRLSVQSPIFSPIMARTYLNEDTVKTMRIIEVLEIKPASLNTILNRIGFIPNIKRQLKSDSLRTMLITLETMGYVQRDLVTKEFGLKAKGLLLRNSQI